MHDDDDDSRLGFSTLSGRLNLPNFSPRMEQVTCLGYYYHNHLLGLLGVGKLDRKNEKS